MRPGARVRAIIVRAARPFVREADPIDARVPQHPPRSLQERPAGEHLHRNGPPEVSPGAREAVRNRGPSSRAADPRGLHQALQLVEALLAHEDARLSPPLTRCALPTRVPQALMGLRAHRLAKLRGFHIRREADGLKVSFQSETELVWENKGRAGLIELHHG